MNPYFDTKFCWWIPVCQILRGFSHLPVNKFLIRFCVVCCHLIQHSPHLLCLLKQCCLCSVLAHGSSWQLQNILELAFSVRILEINRGLAFLRRLCKYKLWTKCKKHISIAIFDQQKWKTKWKVEVNICETIYGSSEEK